MDKLLTVDDVAGILQVSRRTAYTYMRQMVHMERPMRVTEKALAGWITGRMTAPADKTMMPREGKQKAPAWGLPGRNTGDYHIPRRRELIIRDP